VWSGINASRKLGLLPLPIWGEGWGEGVTGGTEGSRTPSPIPLCCKTEKPSPQRGEGTSGDRPALDLSTAKLDDMNGAIFFAAAGMGAKARGQALVAKDGFSARYDLDRVRGIFSRPDHKLAGESYVGRVLVLDAAKGGVATAWMLNEMKARGIMPAALVLNAVNPIMVQGAALADFTMISGFDVDITQAIPNGAMVEVDPTGERPFIRVARLRA
jgi:predicted aconitase with swiveling domain